MLSHSETIAQSGFVAESRYYGNLREVVRFFSSEMGFHLVPVIPIPGLFVKQGQDRANGKAPSVWLANGQPKLLGQSERATYAPNALLPEPSRKLLAAIDLAEQKGWPIGLGTHGRSDVAVLDFDSKNFGTDANGVATQAARDACTKFVAEWQVKNELTDTYSEQTPTGGWHVFVSVRSPDSRVNFTIKGALDVDGQQVERCGEVLWPGSHTVMAPTSRGESEYRVKGPLRFAAVSSVVDLGVSFIGANPAEIADVEVACEELDGALKELVQPPGTEGVPKLSRLLRGMSRDLYDGAWKTDERFFKPGLKQPDRSKVLTTLLNEALSWYKWLADSALPFVDDLNEPGADPEQPELTGIQVLVGEMEAGDKYERILASVVRNVGRLSLLNKNYVDLTAKNDYRRACLSHKGAKAIAPKDVETEAVLVDWLLARFGEKLRYDELKKSILLDKEELDPDGLYIRLARDFGVMGFKEKGTNDAFLVAAKENRFSPVQDYLNSVRTQLLPCRGPAPGTELIPVYEIGKRYFAIEDDFQSRLLGKHLMAAVYRGFNPGIEYQQCLVLRGFQGAGKSTGIMALVPDKDLFASSQILPNDKDLLMAFSSNWHYEFAEVDQLTSRRSAAQLKALISSGQDTFREPYGKKTANHPRASVLWASTNQQQFLVDATGERRWWICDVGGPIDVGNIKADRDLIWASVLHAIDLGEDFRLMPSEYAKSAENAESASTEALLADKLEDYLGEKPWITEEAIFHEMLHMDEMDMSRTGPKAGVVRDVTESLQRMGWTKTKQSIRNLCGRSTTRGVWFSPGVEHTRSGPQLLTMFEHRSLPAPQWVQMLGRISFSSNSIAARAVAELDQTDQTIARLDQIQ